MNFERLWHWERFAPNLGNNLELRPEDQLTLDVAVGLTKVELARVISGLDKMVSPFVDAVLMPDGSTDEPATAAALSAKLDASAVDLAGQWGPFVRLGAGNHSLNGAPLATLRDYLRFVLEQPGAFNAFELFREIGRLNSVEGTRALFSGRPFGSPASTPTPAGARGGNQTAGR